MDELTELRRLRADLPDPTDTVLAEARARLVEHDVRPAVLQKPTVLHPSWPRRRVPGLRGRVLVGIAAAAVVATGAYALTSGDPGRPAPSAPHYKSAAQFLDAASAAALEQGDATVPDGQFRRMHEHAFDTLYRAKRTAGADLPTSVRTTTYYLPADPDDSLYLQSTLANRPAATRDPLQAKDMAGYDGPGHGLYRVGFEGGVTSYEKLPNPHASARPHMDPNFHVRCTERGKPIDCDTTIESPWNTGVPARVAALPSSTAALRKSLFAWARWTAKSNPAEFARFALAGIANVLSYFPASAKLRAALFQVAKSIPGITLHGAMSNYDGVEGVGVGLVDGWGAERNLVFSRDGSHFLGTKDIVRRPGHEFRVPVGTVLHWTAVADRGIGKPDYPKGRK